MEPLDAFLPLDRRLALAKGESPPDRTFGAALVTDISGFMPLIEATIQELGPKCEADELTHQLNFVYNALIAEVHRHRGSVIGFGGDTLTCWFDGDDGQRALRCGLGLQQTAAKFESFFSQAAKGIRLELKTAIASGPARRFRVGDPEIQYIDVLSGPALEKAIAAKHQAQLGEVVVDAAAIAPFSDQIIVKTWRNEPTAESSPAQRFAVVAELNPSSHDSPQQDSSGVDLQSAPAPLPEAQTRPWLLPPVYEGLSREQDYILAEIRPAVALFLKFEGIDYEADDAFQKLDTFIRQVQTILARSEGYLLQLTVKDKGSYLYATFGAPVAHDDDPARAMAAALQLRSIPTALNFISQIQLGLSQGWMCGGAFGNKTRRTYGVLGDETTVAARLMNQAKPGQILVTSRIALTTTRIFQFKNLGLVTLKGKVEPLPILEVIGRRQTILGQVKPKHRKS